MHSMQAPRSKPRSLPLPQICKVAVREARMLKHVVHPNVVTLLEVFRYDDFSFEFWVV